MDHSSLFVARRSLVEYCFRCASGMRHRRCGAHLVSSFANRDRETRGRSGSGSMAGSRRSWEWLVLGGCAFVLSQAVLPLIITPGDTPTEGSPVYRLVLTVSYLSAAFSLVPYYRET